MIKELEFVFEGKLLNVEVEYSVESRESLDVLNVIGEIEDEQGTVYDSEAKEMKRALRSAFVSKYLDEIDEERSERNSFNKSSLRDFGCFKQ